MLRFLLLVLLVRAARRPVTSSDGAWFRWSRVQGAEKLEELEPHTLELARRFLDLADRYLENRATTTGEAWGLKITSTRRTLEEQRALYEAGRSQLSGAPGAESYHQQGKAFDLVLTLEGASVWEDVPLYSELGRLGEAHGLRWGGNWSGFRDVYHFENRSAFA